MDFFDLVTTQRAIRRLKPDAIPDRVLQQILDAAICAPSGGNRQGWSFIVTSGRWRSPIAGVGRLPDEYGRHAGRSLRTTMPWPSSKSP